MASACGWRYGSAFRPLCVFTLLVAAPPLARAAVIGIDFGSRFLKVGIIQPGTGIELVLNEATQRKSSSTAGFNSQDERVYGNEAQNLLGKLPAKQFVLSKILLGAHINSPAVASFVAQRYPYVFEDDEEGHGAVLRYDNNSTFRPEEMAAFVLSYAKQIAEGHAKTPIKDCVITVPPFFGHVERHALMNAASIAGLNVLSLLHEPTAFAFKYGFDKESDFKTDSPTNVVFYDLGMTSYKVSVVSFSAALGKKNKTQGTMQVRGLGWDSSLGGRDFDMIVFDMLAEEFNSKALKGKDDVRNYPKAVGKLRKAAESAKDILSANAKYQVAVESLHEEQDLRMILTREAFEAEAEKRGLWERLVAPLATALAQANLTKTEIHRVEVVGGATRIPRVKEAALKFFDRKALDGSLNGDEAAALGATLYAAKLSTSFRLREFTVSDAYPHAASIRISGSEDIHSGDADVDGLAGSKKPKLLFKANTKMPHKKLISMTRTDDLVATLTLGEPANGASDAGSIISTFNITGVAAAYARLSKDPARQVFGKPKVSVTFALSSSGLMDVSKAEAAIEMLEKYDDYELVSSNMSDPDAYNATSSNPFSDALSNHTATANGTSMLKVKVEKERKRLHYITLKVAKEVPGPLTPITPDIIATAIARNAELLRQEQVRRTNAEAKNGLEAFIIDTRDKMSEYTVEEVSTTEERDAIRTRFDEMEEWLYEDGRSLDARAYQAKTRELNSLTAPVFLRHSELDARPKAASQAREAVNWTLTILETWATERPEITKDERDKISSLCVNFTEWLDSAEAEQAALPLTSPPAFLSATVTAKLDPIESEVRRLIKKPKPKPKPKAKNATEATINTTEPAGTTGAYNTSGDFDAEHRHADGLSEDAPPHDEL